MSRYALVKLSDNSIDRFATNIDPEVQVKTGWKWLLCDLVVPMVYDPLTEKVTGPTYTVGASTVTEVWTKVLLTSQEISDAKDSALNALNGTLYFMLGKALLSLENDNRTIKAKINALITEQSSTVPSFTSGQVSQINLTQLKSGFKALL